MEEKNFERWKVPPKEIVCGNEVATNMSVQRKIVEQVESFQQLESLETENESSTREVRHNN